MDLREAFKLIIDPVVGQSTVPADIARRDQAAETIARTIDSIQTTVSVFPRLVLEHEALKEVVYWLVQNVADDQLRDRLNSAYLQMTSGDPAKMTDAESGEPE